MLQFLSKLQSQLVSMTDLRHGTVKVFKKLHEFGSVYILKGSRIVAVMQSISQYQEDQEYIEMLETERLVLLSKQDPRCYSESQVLSLLTE